MAAAWLAGTLGAGGWPVPAGAEDSVGHTLYDVRCAPCHGLQLEGQPDWHSRNEQGRLPAPPHDETGHTWHHSDANLLRLVRDGMEAFWPGYESDMPQFKGVLSDDEILAILDYIKGHWPEREREYQAQQSARDPLDR